MAYSMYYGVSGTPELTVLDPKVKGSQNANGIRLFAGDSILNKSTTTLKSAKYNLNTDTNSATIIYVVSEKVYVDEMADAGNNSWTVLQRLAADGDATMYYVYGERAAAQTGADLKSIASTLDKNIDINFDASRKEIEITVPWSYAEKNFTDENGDPITFTLNFVTSSMATAYKNRIATADVLESDLGVADNADATVFNVNYPIGSDEPALYVENVNDPIEKIYVQSEDTNTKNPYTVKVKVNEAEKGAQLLSVGASGVTGAIDSNRNIALTLPYGSTKYPVQLELEASKMATIYVGSYDKNKPTQNVYNPETGYDLNSDLPIIVVSENGQNHTEYTLKTTVAENFFDVANDQWYYDEVLKAAENKWVNGTKPGYFEPNGTMTRGDFALIIARIKNYNPALYTESAFPDVESTDYYSAAIAYCKEMGYLGGENGYFNPKDPITREEMAKIICNAAGVEQVTDPTSPYADDDTIAEWAKGYVYGCQAAEIMMGDENANTFDARSNATRAEAAAVLVRAFA